MTAADQLAAIEARAEGLTDLCKEHLRQSIRHVQRNCDIDCNVHEAAPTWGDCKQPGRYDGGRMAESLADIPALLATIREQAAKLEAVRVLHKAAHRDVATWARGHRWAGHHCTFDGEHWPCETIAALGAGDE